MFFVIAQYMYIAYVFMIVHIKHVYIRVYRSIVQRARVDLIGNHKCLVTFYVGDTKMQMVVTRKVGPPAFYMATDEFGNDITEDIMPYAHCTVERPTPKSLGYTKIDAWDMFDNRVGFSENETIRL